MLITRMATGAGREIADQLKGEMIRNGNTSDDDKYAFKESTSYSWD